MLDPRRLEPTPESLRNGRRTLWVTAAIFGIIAALTLLLPGFADAQMLAILGATLITLAGTAIQYLGAPSLLRYRIGMVVTAVGIIGSLWFLLADPLPGAAG